MARPPTRSPLFPYTTLFRSDEISQLLIESWQLGVKAIAIYRDNCKVAQPLSKKGDAGATTLAPVGAVAGALPQRRRLRSEEHTSELQSLRHLVCRLLLEKNN